MEENRSLIAKAKELIGFDKHLKPEQVECLISALEGQDVMAVLPTGFGKSLVFQLAPFVIGLKRGNSVDNIDCCALVITPLNSIMVDQCQSLCKMGIRACALDYTCVHAETFTNDSDSDHSDTENESILTTVSLDDIVRGKYQVVYAHPEALLQTARGERLLNRLSHSKRLACVAVDEAHMILEWGSQFRKDFSRIGDEIISRFPDLPALVFTATASPTAQQQLIKTLRLNHPKLITVNPDRPNIMYRKVFRPPSMDTEKHLESILTPMVEQLKEEKEAYPMTIFYTDTSVISFAYAFFEKYMGADQYVGSSVPENRLFAQYQQVYTDEMKQFIVKELCKDRSKIRLVFATVALGMGLNAPHIKHVVHYKPPTSLEKYFQETGRAGRDGQQSTALLYYNNTDIRSNRPGIENDIITYCRNDSRCYRVLMLEHFGYTPTDQVPEGFCCDFCNN